MFTPPPSPNRPSDAPRASSGYSRQSTSNVPDSPPPPSSDRPPFPPRTLSQDSLKRRIGRRTKWTVVLVPLALVLITASTRFLTHPVAFDIFSGSPTSSWPNLPWHATDWSLHKRHGQGLNARDDATTSAAASLSGLPAGASVSPVGSATSGSSSPATTTAIVNQAVPTIPASPPGLPSPFPQAYDSNLSQNFSSLSCFNFFSNMTNSVSFRSCRPFSLLLQSSQAFINAQTDLNLLNNIVWGTCSTTIDNAQCSENMAWFSNQLLTACAADLTAGNSMAVSTQIGLNAFDLMRSAGCLSDPTTNTYCYVDAVHNANPSDVYYYSVPLGVSLPNNSIASCSPCTKSLMTLYYGSLENTTQSGNGHLSALNTVYDSAAKLAVQDCGTNFASLLKSAGSPTGSVSPLTLLLTQSALLLLLLSSTVLLA